MYLDQLGGDIRRHIPEDRMPEGDVDELLRMYALLARSKGTGVTDSDVHDAWSVWMAQREGAHEALVPYEDLPKSVRQQDAVFTAAIRSTAAERGLPVASHATFLEVLFPSGPPEGPVEIQQTVDLYKIMVQSSESLVGRRQGVNTFFLTMNGALLTASGLVVQSSGGSGLGVLGVAVLAVAGAILCRAWSSLITSFGQLNRGKFQVINTIERHLKAAIYAAEWEALGRGEDPQVYRAFTSREIWVPHALLTLHVVTAIAALGVALKPLWSQLWVSAA